MRINHNIAALNTYRQLSANNVMGNKSLEKLSSGLRINRAGDDAAGLAISEKMRGQIRGLDMAAKNAQDGISLIQTAEGALNETHSILQRMRELAVQSANDTNVVIDRSELQKEVDQLAKEISRIGQTTQFNTQNLLNGDFDGVFHIGANEGQNLQLEISDMRANSLTVVGDAKIELTAEITSGGSGQAIADNKADGTYTIDGANLKDANGNVVATTSDSGKTWVGNEAGTLGKDTITFEQKVDTGTITISNNEVTGTAQFTHKLEAGDYTIELVGSGYQLLDGGKNVVATSSSGIEFKSAKDNTTVLLTLDAKASGVTTDNSYTVNIGGLDISSQSTANSAITTINNAIENVSAERAKLGALQNRLEHTINNLGTSSENLTAAESRIRDVDMAKEMMEFTKMSILAQAANAMLAQANQQPQGVLQLLR
jgi:flagellin